MYVRVCVCAGNVTYFRGFAINISSVVRKTSDFVYEVQTCKCVCVCVRVCVRASRGTCIQ